jgi:hypothetical protein
MSGQDFLPERLGIEALRASPDLVGDLITMERGVVGRNPSAALDIYIAGTAVGEVARVEQFVDVAVRRAAAFFEFGPQVKFQKNGDIRPLPSSQAGLLFEAIEVGSYRAKHKLKGKAEQHAKEHPILYPLMVQLLGASIIHFVGGISGHADSPHQYDPPDTIYVVEPPPSGATVVIPPSGAEFVIPNDALGNSLDSSGQSRMRPQPATPFQWTWTVSAMGESYTIRPQALP